MAVAAIVALASASSATITASMVFAAVAQAGTILSIVGAVTGNKDMMKVGGTMGLIGGIGGLATGAFTGAAGQAAADTTTSGAADVGAQVGAAGSQTAASGVVDYSSMGGGELAGAAGTGADIGALGMEGATVAAPVAQGAGDLAMNIGPAGAGVDAASAATNVGNTLSAGANAPIGPMGPFTATESLTEFNNTFSPYKQTSFNAISEWMDKNKTMTGLGGQVIGGAMQGMYAADVADKDRAMKQKQIDLVSHGNKAATYTGKGLINSAAGA